MAAKKRRERRRGEGRIFQLPNSPNLAIRYYEPGPGGRKDYRREFGFRTYEEAEAKLDERIAEIRNATRGLVRYQGPRAERLRVKEGIASFLRDQELNGRKAVKRTKSHANAVLAELGEYRCSGLSPSTGTHSSRSGGARDVRTRQSIAGGRF